MKTCICICVYIVLLKLKNKYIFNIIINICFLMENYEVLDLIGKGNFGSISKILRKSDDKILVWKELDYGRMSEKEKQSINKNSVFRIVTS